VGSLHFKARGLAVKRPVNIRLRRLVGLVADDLLDVFADGAFSLEPEPLFRLAVYEADAPVDVYPHEQTRYVIGDKLQSLTTLSELVFGKLAVGDIAHQHEHDAQQQRNNADRHEDGRARHFQEAPRLIHHHTVLGQHTYVDAVVFELFKVECVPRRRDRIR